MSGIREWLTTAREERWGMLTDLAFAIVWVSIVELIFSLVDGPIWAYYLFMAAGVAAYFGLIFSFKMAVAQQDQRH